MAIKLLELANKIFGRKKVSQQMGTKTGVKLLSGGKNDPFKGIYNVEMLKNNPKALEEAKKQAKNPVQNDQFKNQVSNTISESLIKIFENFIKNILKSFFIRENICYSKNVS